MPFLDSYKNHILHCSIYMAAIAATAAHFLLLFSGDWDLNVTLLSLVCATAILCLLGEIHYIILRIGLPAGDSGLPIVGGMSELIVGPMEFKRKGIRKYGSPHTFNLFMKPIVSLVKEEDLLWALKQERQGNLIPNLIDHGRALIGEDSIMLQDGAGHKTLRRIFEPSFQPTTVKTYLQLIDDTTLQEFQRWSSDATGTSTDTQKDGHAGWCTSDAWAELAMRLFFVCAFGQAAIDEEAMKTLSDLFHRWISGFMAIVPLRIPGTCLYDAHVARGQLGSVLQTMIDDFKSNNPPNSLTAQTTMMGRLCYHGVDGGKEDHNSKSDRNNNMPLSNSQLITNIQFILFAGHDTTKGSFGAFCHFWINETPANIQTMLLQEVNSFGEPLNADELKSAPLLNAFLAETWRLVPPLDSHNLKATKTLEYKGYRIPKGVGISLDLQNASVYAQVEDRSLAHGDGKNTQKKKTIKNPEKFCVERWLPKGHPLYDPEYHFHKVDYNVMSPRYPAFNMGNHSCLGGHFAKLEARVVFTRLLQKYDIELRSNSLTVFPLRQYKNEFKLTPKGR